VTLITFLSNRESKCVSLGKTLQLAGVCFALLLCLPAYSQTLGRISGIVTDTSGGAISGATVTVTDVGRAIPRNVTTDNAGSYSAPNLIPGMYSVHATYTGFKAFDQQNIDVGVGGDVHVDVTLQPGEQSQTVTVTGEAPAIVTSNAQLTATIDSNTLADLPIAGHNYVQLLALLPTFMLRQGSATGPNQFSNGLRGEFNVYVLDGVTDSSTYYTTFPLNTGYSAGGPEQAVMLPTDSIQEFNVVDNAKAEYGWRPGAQINIAIKSGTNSLHGAAYASGRNTGLTDRNAFATLTPPVKFIDFDTTIGGPIKKDKLFFLAGFEGQIYNVGNPKNVNVPTLASGAGSANSIPDAITALQAKGIAPNPVMVALAGCTLGPPVSCTPGKGLFSNNSLSTTFPIDYLAFGHSDNGVGRLDYHLNEHNNISGEFFDGDGFAAAPLSASQAYWSTPFEVHTEVARAWWTWVPNSSWVNDLRFGWDHILISNTGAYDCPTNPGSYLGFTDNQWISGSGAPDYAKLANFVSGGLPQCGSSGNSAFPTISIAGFTGGNGAAVPGGSPPVLGGATTTLDTSGIERWVDSVSWTHGNHITKFGGEFNLDHGTIDLNADRNKGSLAFLSNGTTTGLMNFMAGVVGKYSIQEGTVPRQFVYHSTAGYIQDDWRITQRLTLNLGLRYENNSTVREVNNLFGNVDLTSATGVIQQGQEKLLYKFAPTAFAPRLGLAYDIAGKGTTVLRAGANIAYQNTTIQGFITPGMNQVPTGLPLTNISAGTTVNEGGSINLFYLKSQTPPAGANTIVAGTPFFSSSLVGTGTTGCTSAAPCTIGGTASELQMPRVFNWNLGVQHAITRSLTLDAEYVGTKGQHLFDYADMNQPAPGSSTNATIENARRPFFTKFPYLSQINVVGSIPAWSNYNGLQLIARERANHGLTFLATYTYAHALDTESSDLNPVIPQDARCVTCEYGNTSYDLRHHVTMGITYDIPGKSGYARLLKGWQISTTANVFSGRPFNAVDTSDDISGTGENQDRWNLMGTPKDFDTKFGTTQGIPCYDAGLAGTSGTWKGACINGPVNAPTIWQQCVNAANSLPNSPAGTTGNTTGLAMLNNFGCYAMGGSVIVPSSQGNFGNMSRYELYSVGTWEWDGSVVKAWQIKERLTAQFRADFYNITNATFFSAPTANLNSPSSFGVATSTPDTNSPFVGTGGPRKIQLGLKLLF
jgi:hypothetical protein